MSVNIVVIILQKKNEKKKKTNHRVRRTQPNTNKHTLTHIHCTNHFIVPNTNIKSFVVHIPKPLYYGFGRNDTTSVYTHSAYPTYYWCHKCLHIRFSRSPHFLALSIYLFIWFWYFPRAMHVAQNNETTVQTSTIV